MDEDEVVIGQLGLLLTQVHYARIALEGIERATTRYAGIALSMSGSGGSATPWGAPPMIDGALKVYVVNIGDLTSGSSVLEAVGGVISGAGRFLGGIVGGFVGGTIGGVILYKTVGRLADLLEHLDSVLVRLGIGSGSSGSSGAPFLDQLKSFTELLSQVKDILTGLGAGLPAGAQSGSGGDPGGIVAALRPALALAIAATNLVDGLVLLIPIVVGALAWLLDHLQDIELAVLDLLTFGLRAALLLRAAVLGAVLDAVSLAGNLAATTLGLVMAALDVVIPSVFRLIVAGLNTALDVLQIASTGIKNLLDGLLPWLRDGLGAVLVYLGNLRVFRLVEHLAQIVPAMLPAIARLMDKPLTPLETRALRAAAAHTGPGLVTPPSALSVPPAPDLAALALPISARRDLAKGITELGDVFVTESRTSLGAVQGTLGGIGANFRRAVDGLDSRLGDEVRTRVSAANADTADLVSELNKARQALRERPQTGLEQIATAYEAWLSGSGMSTLLDQLERHFQGASTQGPDAGRSLAGRTVRAVLADPSDRRVVVEVDEVVVELDPSGPAVPDPGSPVWAYDPDAARTWQTEFDDRGGLALT